MKTAITILAIFVIGCGAIRNGETVIKETKTYDIERKQLVISQEKKNVVVVENATKKNDQEIKNSNTDRDIDDQVTKDHDKQKKNEILQSLAAGILEIKTNDKQWGRCGVVEKELDVFREWSIEWSRAIISASEYGKRFQEERIYSKMTGYNRNNTTVVIDPYFIAALIYKETKFDECAIGPYVRKIAIRKNKMPARHGSITKTKQEIIKAITDKQIAPLFAKTGVDLGPCQILSLLTNDPFDYESQLTLDSSVKICAIQMVDRGRIFPQHAKKPYSLWPGHYSYRYGKEIENIEKKIRGKEWKSTSEKQLND